MARLGVKNAAKYTPAKIKLLYSVGKKAPCVTARRLVDIKKNVRTWPSRKRTFAVIKADREMNGRIRVKRWKREARDGWTEGPGGSVKRRKRERATGGNERKRKRDDEERRL